MCVGMCVGNERGEGKCPNGWVQHLNQVREMCMHGVQIEPRKAGQGYNMCLISYCMYEKVVES